MLIDQLHRFAGFYLGGGGGGGKQQRVGGGEKIKMCYNLRTVCTFAHVN